MDEWRFYDRALSMQEVYLNYNNGIGSNPAKTVGLKIWYTFYQADPDTDLFPAGNPLGWPSGRYGVRDMSGNGNHAMPLNMTNDATLGGVVKLW